MSDRRRFLQQLGSAALAAGLPDVSSATPSRGARIERIGLQLYTVRHVLEKDFEGTLATVAAAGYREVEFAGYFGKSPAEVRAILDRHGLASPAVHVGSVAPDQWRQSLNAAHRIGHPSVGFPWNPGDARHAL